MNAKLEMFQQALLLLKRGELVIVPTDSVYGLVADPYNHRAVEKLMTVKRRKQDHSLPIAIADPLDIQFWANDVPDVGYQLIRAFWPGSLTLVVKKAPWVPLQLTGGQDTVGLRCPNYPLLQQMIAQFGDGVVMTSANISGQKSAITAKEAKNQLGNKVSLIIDGGRAKQGIASTVVDVAVSPVKIYRQGVISLDAINKVINNN